MMNDKMREFAAMCSAPTTVSVNTPLPNGLCGFLLRDYFAAVVLPDSVKTCTTFEQAALEAYAIADAMMKVRTS